MTSRSPEGVREFYEKDYVRSCDITSIPRNDNFMYAQVLREIRPYLRAGIKVLDLGCNNGNLSLYMASFGCEVLGIDLARNAIETARRSAKFNKICNVQFESMDFLLEWNRPEVFDFVLCSHVIEHIPQDDLFLQKVFFATKPNGHLLLLAPTEYSSMYRINKLLTGRFAFDEETGHLRRYTTKSITALTEKAGFQVDDIVFLDSFLREWFIICKPLRVFHGVLGRRYIRTIFNEVDRMLAKFLFPASICVHAKKNTQGSVLSDERNY